MTAQGFDHDLLSSIDKHMASVDASLKEILALSKLRKAPPSQGRAPNSETTASDSDLDSAKGDETIRMDPRDWSGASCKGKRMSECPSAFLEMYAEAMAYFATKNDKCGEKDSKGGPKSVWDRKSEARARGWAIRNRNKPAQAAEPDEDFGGAGSF